MDELQDTLSVTVVHCTRKQFARHGIPECCVTDGGPQFVSQEYHNFSKTWAFNHITSSPYHTQGNAKAESVVKVAKNLLKSERGNGDFEMPLLEFRNTPGAVVETSAVQRLIGRRTHTILPTTAKLLYPETVEPVLVQ